MSKHKEHIDAEASGDVGAAEEQNDLTSAPEAVAVSPEEPDLADTNRSEADAAQSDEKDTKIEELIKRVDTLTAENSELKDQYLRKAADYENFRKRMTREREEAVNFANTSLILDLIGIVDNFDRALHATDAASDPSHLRGGVEMIEGQMLSMLENKWGLSRFSAKGSTFDPDVHEAIAREDRDDITEPTVVDEFLAGYRLHGRVVRTAKVKVGMPKAPVTAAGTPAAGVDSASQGVV